MQFWSEMEPVLARGIASFLGCRVPEIGGDRWWEHHVVLQLTPSQAAAAETIREGDLGSLDLAALLRVTARNWSELAHKFRLNQSGRDDLHRLADARNRHAHRPVKGVPIGEVQEDVAAAFRLLECIGAAPALIEQSVRILQRITEHAVPDADPHPPSSQGYGSGAARKATTITLDAKAGGATEQSAASHGEWLIEPNTHHGTLEAALAEATYIGIDFGTSTTVVSFAYMDADRQLTSDTFKIAQPIEGGGTMRNHLVNSVLAYTKQQVLFGQDAHRLRPRLDEGKNVFTSFKMHLGVDLGPTYPRSSLRSGYGPIVVERATDATTEFFKLLRAEIVAIAAARKLQPTLKYAISVPASFEANQRRALLACAENAGIAIDSSSLIDEPNAAFLSFMNECIHRDLDVELASQLRERGLNVLVYDFGAGTCDVSILKAMALG